jgi:hypothetical protein
MRIPLFDAIFSLRTDRLSTLGRQFLVGKKCERNKTVATKLSHSCRSAA